MSLLIEAREKKRNLKLRGRVVLEDADELVHGGAPAGAESGTAVGIVDEPANGAGARQEGAKGYWSSFGMMPSEEELISVINAALSNAWVDKYGHVHNLTNVRAAPGAP